ncbi:MAG: hypothetical protein WCY56_09695, partial [Aminobacteriaceae bacterium]
MTKNNTFVFLIILLLSFGMIGGSYYLVNQTKILRQTETNLRIQKKKAELRIDEKMRQIEVYKRAIAQLERYQIELPENEVEFYSWVQQELTD